MMLGAALVAALIYLAGLFWLAAWRDRRAGSGTLARHAGTVYGLSLAVYCTSWTFFGGVGTAATAGLDYLPIYLGPILLFSFGFPLLRKILAQAKAQHSTSIADFLSARYGKSASLAAPLVSIHPDPLVSGVILSLSVNTLLYWFGSGLARPTLLDQAQAAAFVGTPMPGAVPRHATAKRIGMCARYSPSSSGASGPTPRSPASRAALPCAIAIRPKRRRSNWPSG
jgi:hypothetical protein